jgi:hypothetical protein
MSIGGHGVADAGDATTPATAGSNLLREMRSKYLAERPNISRLERRAARSPNGPSPLVLDTNPVTSTGETTPEREWIL